MFICPICNAEFNKEENIKLHFLSCWKEQHPFHQSKSAPRKEDIIIKKVSDDITNFFNSFNEGNNAGNIN